MLIVLLILAALILLVWFLVRPGRRSAEGSEIFFHRYIAHRGLHTPDKLVPENSMPAFRRAVGAGYGIELDIQLSRDGQVVVFHDDTLGRVCGVDARVDSMDYDQLKTLPLCGSSEHMPLFSEVLAAVAGRAPIIIEFKRGPRNRQLCRSAVELLAGYRGPYCIESFDPTIVHWFKWHRRGVWRGQLASNYHDLHVNGHQSAPTAFLLSNCLLNFLGRPQFIAYNKEKTSLTAKLAESLGAQKVVWTVRPDDDIAFLQETNDTIIFEFCRVPEHW